MTYAQQKYEKTGKGMFVRQRANARRRKVEWSLTYDEWQQIWNDSGKFDKRGTGAGTYCMARKFDEGAYSVENVEIVPNSQNSKLSYKRTLKQYNNPEKAIKSEYPDNYPWHNDLGWKHPTPLPAYSSGVYSD